ncbi:MAG: tRNA threonylcarbamoyladenosine dehydratase [Anaerovoracaceae bacterium]|nr:tRNA threonylcarbamoyladenosine dehydratase [Anaerovoracaceae bacterium]
MLNQFSRTELLFGRESMEKLSRCRVAVFGIGGVGGYTVEALARSGIGALDLIDDDKICLTNLNRQLHATRKTVGMYKVDVAAQRIAEINPDAQVRTYKTFFMPDTAEQFDFTQYDYVVDAIDTVTGKVALVEAANAARTPIISSMGAGNKLDPTALRSGGYLPDFCMSSGESHAKGAAGPGHPCTEGSLFKRTCYETHRGHVHQLPCTLHLPAGNRQKMYPAPPGARQQRLCSIGGRPDHCW